MEEDNQHICTQGAGFVGMDPERSECQWCSSDRNEQERARRACKVTEGQLTTMVIMLP